LAEKARATRSGGFAVSGRDARATPDYVTAISLWLRAAEIILTPTTALSSTFAPFFTPFLFPPALFSRVRTPRPVAVGVVIGCVATAIMWRVWYKTKIHVARKFHALSSQGFYLRPKGQNIEQNPP
jgi:hypothetical protein